MEPSPSSPPAPRSIFLTGATGYLGQRLVPALLQRGHRVRALVRAESMSRLAEGAEPVVGSALDASSFTDRVAPAETFVQLIGTPRPSPAKARQFRAVDLVSVRESVAAAVAAGTIRHFVYLSVAQPAPVMKVYQEVRAAGEAAISAAGFPASFLRPWYVLGPGHRWPYLLLPAYWFWERVPATRETARRLGLVTLPQMITALVAAIENPPVSGQRIVDVPAIRKSAQRSTPRP